ncbi:MAG TPA: DUF1345 domain-containing protein [Pirellulales bacterium]|jgi:uncharacterized membrane protein|nr:DUF1345 domain-containing protein [Rhizomicrobium sp.]HVU87761.1 DUF1345 domain-containing protein [Pirellulales bacterium]
MATNSDTRRGIPILGPFLSRPYLLTAIAIGIALYAASTSWGLAGVTRALIGWNGGVIVFLLLMFFLFMRKTDIAMIKQRAITHDEGGHFILVLTILASVASVGALIAELSLAKEHPGEMWRVALAGATVVLSWLFVQVVFAMHYAHLYYLEEEEGAPKGGLEFGQCGEPDYWDFFHFSIVMGATSQTADITFSSKEMRRVGTLHTLVAFGFNTAILATMINLAANFI